MITKTYKLILFALRHFLKTLQRYYFFMLYNIFSRKIIVFYSFLMQKGAAELDYKVFKVIKVIKDFKVFSPLAF